MTTEQTNSLAVIANCLPAVQTDDAVFKDLAKRGNFLGRIQLYSKGAAINRKLIGIGEFGIPRTDDEITSLGESIDYLPLARRVKAMDTSGKEIIVVYDHNDPEFNRIKEASSSMNSGCMYGISVLVFERSSGEFLELFFGTKTLRGEVGKVYPFLPHNDSAGNFVAPKPVTMKSRLIEYNNNSWHGVTISACSVPIQLPSVEEVTKEVQSFLNPPKVEKVEDDKAEKRSGRAR